MSILYKLATPENISKLTILLKVINHLCITTPQDIHKLQDLFITINVLWSITKAIFLLLYFVIHGRRGKSLAVFFTIYISVQSSALGIKIFGSWIFLSLSTWCISDSNIIIHVEANHYTRAKAREVKCEIWTCTIMYATFGLMWTKAETNQLYYRFRY